MTDTIESCHDRVIAAFADLRDGGSCLSASPELGLELPVPCPVAYLGQNRLQARNALGLSCRLPLIFLSLSPCHG